ncbi:LexA repressor [Mycolicibacterium aubagnense]
MKNNIAYLRKQKGLSQADLAAEIGIHWTNLSKIENDRSDPGMDRFQQIAGALGVKPADLFSEIEGFREDGPAYDSAGSQALLQFAGEAQAGVWRDVNIYANDEAQIAAISPDPRYRKARQYVWQVLGDSMDKAGIADGMYVVGADYWEFSERYRPIETGDIVVVERLRFDGQERERTIKRYQRIKGHVVLMPESSNPHHKPIHIPKDGIVEGEQIKIIAYVSGAFSLFGKAIYDLDEGQKILL